MGPRARDRRRDRRGRPRRVGRTADGRGGHPAPRPPGQRDPRLQAAHRARARAAVRPGGHVVPGLGRRGGVADRVRRARDVGGPEAGRPAGHRRAGRDAGRRRRRRQLGLRVAARRPRRAADQGRRPLPQRRRRQHPGQGRARPGDAGPRRALPALVVRHEQGLPVPGAQGGAAGLRPVGHPPPHVGLHGPLRPVARRPPHLPPRPRPTSVSFSTRGRCSSLRELAPLRRPAAATQKPLRCGDGGPSRHSGQAGVTVTGMPVMWAWLEIGS